MSEETGAESVTSTEAPVAIDPSQLNKPVRPEAQSSSSADDELLKHKLGLANQHAKQAKKDADDARAQLNQLKQELEEQKALQQSAAQKNLEDQGAFKQLWEDAKRTVNQRDAEIVELKARIVSVTEERSRDQLKAALSQINSAGVINSQQMYLLLQSALRMDDEGNPAVLNGALNNPWVTILPI